jgi:hypothetical protein
MKNNLNEYDCNVCAEYQRNGVSDKCPLHETELDPDIEYEESVINKYLEEEGIKV